MPDFNSKDAAALMRRVKSKSAEEGDFSLLSRYYMEQGKYDKARYLCASAVEQCGRKRQDFFTSLGVCEWLLGNGHDAINAWRAGRKCGYRDPAGGLYPLVLMWFGGAVLADTAVLEEATSYIEEGLKSDRAVHWPGPIARYLIDRAEEEELFSDADERDRNLIQPSLGRTARFFVAVKSLKNGDVQRAIALFTKCVQTLPDAAENDLYLARDLLLRLDASHEPLRSRRKRAGNGPRCG